MKIFKKLFGKKTQETKNTNVSESNQQKVDISKVPEEQDNNILEQTKQMLLNLLKSSDDYTDQLRAEDAENEGFTNERWLQIAVGFGHVESVRNFIKFGIKPDQSNGSILGYLSKEGNPVEVAKLLISNGADVNHKDNDGSSPLHTAAHFGLLDLVKLFISFGAKNVKDNDGRTPADEAMHWGHEEVGKFLSMKAGYSCNCDGFLPQDELRWFTCSCGGKALVPANVIDKERGINFIHPECKMTSFIPPSVWCPKCGKGLVPSWQKQVKKV